MAGTADDIQTPNTGNVWLDALLWGREWSSGGGRTVISTYIAGQAFDENVTLTDTFGDSMTVTATSPFAGELRAMRAAMTSLESVCNLDFREVSSQGAADLIWASVSDADLGSDGTLGLAYPPGEGFRNGEALGVVAINWELYDPASGPTMLVRGGYDFCTFIHELGHAVGLAHPHDDGGGSTRFPGVTDAFGDFGNLAMNQGLYTMMGYNDGWPTGPAGVSPSLVYGYQAGPMALDIAALQRMYGANMTVRTGNDTYLLPTANKVGTYYSCIWDAGGIDRIVGGDHGNTIDLRAATLAFAPGGGGVLSHARGADGGYVHGGFTIANRAVIENATGGAGRDTIRGNGADNVLSGLAGQDRLNGAAGNDVLQGGSGSDTLVGSTGDDRLTGGMGADRIECGAGFDRIIFRAAVDSGIGAGRDVVAGFSARDDQILLAAIDASGGAAGNGAFRLDNGGTFALGEIRQIMTGSNLLLEMNLDGDSRAEMSILLLGLTSPLDPDAFVL
ncbi:matrixin family metalloprotease [Rubellimicrobium rubrum]|uniref:Matrixin family metalloprotease n=1 Tax=Rubellimicrobium rubrum TaxID=2585369 RepID=A0A5C4N283_9RHOB|nr:M10 family metallopeptidase [Rubellimicrobium rubrum]TNC51494.1 matrixin family metalloprotease [Rubellimicrobium rubrum]